MIPASWIRSIAAWWKRVHPPKSPLEAIPAYREAANRERRAIAARNTQAIHRARLAKREVIMRALKAVQ